MFILGGIPILDLEFLKVVIFVEDVVELAREDEEPDPHAQAATLAQAQTLARLRPRRNPQTGGPIERIDLDARTERLMIGGMRVALLPKKNRGEAVNVALRLNLGDEKSLVGQRAAASAAGQMLGRGTTRFTRTQLSDELERLKVSGRIGGGGASFFHAVLAVEEDVLVGHGFHL